MYLDYFGLNRLPFSIAPDPELLYLSPSHHEALAHLNYALTSHGGLICLTGEVGMGKTTLCRAFVEQAPDHVDIAYVFNPMLSAPELLQTICSELEVSCEGAAEGRSLTNKELVDCLYQSLLERYAAGRKVICIIDEAQSMPAPLLEQIRLLTNLETNREKLLTLILVGQPELQVILSQHSVRQLDQRITARFHLPTMSRKQLKPYLEHRLRRAGSEVDLFTVSAISVIWAGSKGIPRLINSIADRALLGAYATASPKITKTIAQQSVKEVVGRPIKKTVKTSLAFGRLVLGVVVALSVTFLLLANLNQEKLMGFESLWNESPYRRLADMSGLDVSSAEFTSCASIEENSDLACLTLDWSLVELQKLNKSMAVYNGEHWQVVPSNKLTYLPLRSVILWQPVEGYVTPVKPGESHQLITWVRETLSNESSLSDWKVIAPGGASQHGFDSYYDPILAQQVANFQQLMGLTADRIIGLKTILALQDKKLNSTTSKEAR